MRRGVDYRCQEPPVSGGTWPFTGPASACRWTPASGSPLVPTLCALLVALAIAPSAIAQLPAPSLDAQLSAQQARIGEQVTLRVTLATRDSGVRFSPRVGPEFGPFRVVAVRAPAATQASGAPASTWEFVITAFEEGQTVIPSVWFDGVDAQGRRVQPVGTKALAINVVAPDVDPRSPLKPLKPPISNSLPGLLLAVAGAVLLVAVGISSLGALIWRRVNSRARLPKPAPGESPARILAELESLRRMEARTAQEKREIFARLFHGVRAISRHWFGVAAEGLSSPELAGAAAGAGCGQRIAIEFGEALASIDEARFAPLALEAADSTAAVARTLAAVGSIRSAVKAGGAGAGAR